MLWLYLKMVGSGRQVQNTLCIYILFSYSLWCSHIRFFHIPSKSGVADWWPLLHFLWVNSPVLLMSRYVLGDKNICQLDILSKKQDPDKDFHSWQDIMSYFLSTLNDTPSLNFWTSDCSQRDETSADKKSQPESQLLTLVLPFYSSLNIVNLLQLVPWSADAL